MGEMADFALEQSEAEIEHYYRYADAPLHIQYEEGLIDETGATIGKPWSTPTTFHCVKPTGEGKCPRCGGQTALRKGAHGKFYGCLKFPDCKGSRNY